MSSRSTCKTLFFFAWIPACNLQKFNRTRVRREDVNRLQTNCRCNTSLRFLFVAKQYDGGSICVNVRGKITRYLFECFGFERNPLDETEKCIWSAYVRYRQTMHDFVMVMRRRVRMIHHRRRRIIIVIYILSSGYRFYQIANAISHTVEERP